MKLNEDDFLAPGISLFGDNAYVNTSYMVTPYLMVSEGVFDDFNFFQSQLRINIECAFGMLVNRWRILKTPMSNLRMGKVVSITLALCRLHNFIIDDNKLESFMVPQKYHRNQTQCVDMQSDVNGNPLSLLNGGAHFDEFERSDRKARAYLKLPNEVITPRVILTAMVHNSDLQRPRIHNHNKKV